MTAANAPKVGPWMTMLHQYRGGPDDEPFGLTDADARKADVSAERLDALLDHIEAMADDAYLIGHEEWIHIVEEARAIKSESSKT